MADAPANRRASAKIARALTALPLPVARLEEFDNCRDAWRKCQARLNDIEKSRLAHNQGLRRCLRNMPIFQYGGIIAPQSCPARAVVNGEQSLLVLAGAGSGKTSVLVARAGWLLTTGEAVADQILLLAFGRKAAQEMDERIQARLHTQISRRARSTPSLYTSFNRAAKVPVVSKLENDAQARRAVYQGMASAVQ